MKEQRTNCVSYTVDPGEHEKNWETSYRARWHDVEEEAANHSERTNVQKKRWKQSDLILDVRCFRRAGAAAAWNVHSNLLGLSVTRSFLVVPKKKRIEREKEEWTKERNTEKAIYSVWLGLAYNLNRINLFSSLFFFLFILIFIVFPSLETMQQRTVYLNTLIFFFGCFGLKWKINRKKQQNLRGEEWCALWKRRKESTHKSKAEDNDEREEMKH